MSYIFDWDLECCDLPEEDPGQEFMEDFDHGDHLNHDVVRTVKNEEVIVSDQVIDVLAEAPEECLAVMGANEIVRMPQKEQRWYEFQDDGLHLEGGAILADEKEQLVWARDNNRTLFREMIFSKYPEYLEIAQNAEVDEALAWYRMLRSVTPALNIISKKIDVLSCGLSTLGKIRNSVDFAYEIGAPRSIVIFGVGNNKHVMGYHPDVRLCVDSNSQSYGKESSYYIEGNLEDWKRFVSPGDMIISDCSIGDSEEAGMEIPGHYYDVYKEMISDGFYVICKVNKNSTPYHENWSVADCRLYREHNLEAFITLSPVPVQNDMKFRDLDLHLGMMEANDHRMKRILGRWFENEGVRLQVKDQELDKALGMSNVVCNIGVKNYSVVHDVFDRYAGRLGREWKKLCLDKNANVLDFEDKLTINVEMPCVLIDVEYLAADKERLFTSFFHACIMEWFEEVGWVATEMKH